MSAYTCARAARRRARARARGARRRRARRGDPARQRLRPLPGATSPSSPRPPTRSRCWHPRSSRRSASSSACSRRLGAPATAASPALGRVGGRRGRGRGDPEHHDRARRRVAETTRRSAVDAPTRRSQPIAVPHGERVDRPGAGWAYVIEPSLRRDRRRLRREDRPLPHRGHARARERAATHRHDGHRARPRLHGRAASRVRSTKAARSRSSTPTAHAVCHGTIASARSLAPANSLLVEGFEGRRRSAKVPACSLVLVAALPCGSARRSIAPAAGATAPAASKACATSARRSQESSWTTSEPTPTRRRRLGHAPGRRRPRCGKAAKSAPDEREERALNTMADYFEAPSAMTTTRSRLSRSSGEERSQKYAKAVTTFTDSTHATQLLERQLTPALRLGRADVVEAARAARLGEPGHHEDRGDQRRRSRRSRWPGRAHPRCRWSWVASTSPTAEPATPATSRKPFDVPRDLGREQLGVERRRARGPRTRRRRSRSSA